MPLLFLYPTKSHLHKEMGKPLAYEETSIFGAEYKGDGEYYGGGNLSLDWRLGRRWDALITIDNGVISKIK